MVSGVGSIHGVKYETKFKICSYRYFSGVSLRGCAAGSKTRVTLKKGDMEAIIEHEQGGSLIDELLKPVSSLIASSGFIDESEWNSFDPENFYVKLENTNSTSQAKSVRFKLYSFGSEIASKTFTTKTIGNNVYLSDPDGFKQWADGYVVDVDEVRFTLDLSTTYFQSGSLTAQYYENGRLVAAATTHNVCSDGENQFICTVD